MKLYNYNGILISGAFEDNISFSYAYDEDAQTNYTVFRINRNRVDGGNQFPFVRYVPSRTTAYELAVSEGWDMVINAGIGEGLIIEDSTLITDTAASAQAGVLPLTINGSGDLGYVEANTTGKGQTYINNGAVSAVCGFFPVIENYQNYNYPTNIPNTFELPNWVNAQRQVIGQFGNGDYCIITGAGRGVDNSVGLTIPQEQIIGKKLGLKFAYNLDGGGSTSTVLGERQVSPVYEGTHGRLRSLFIVFNGSDTFSVPNA